MSEQFNPTKEVFRATGENIANFAMHPALQSQRAKAILQQLFLEWANQNRGMSPLDPNNRPGVPQEALPASRGMLSGM